MTDGFPRLSDRVPNAKFYPGHAEWLRWYELHYVTQMQTLGEHGEPVYRFVHRPWRKKSKLTSFGLS